MLRPGRSLGWPSTLLGACLVLACSGSEKNPAAPSVNTGGTQAGGMQNESGASAEGGNSGTASGGTGGATASGGRGGRGGASQGGKSAMGGAAPNGGADPNGGMFATGGADRNGGAGPTGGASPSGGMSATGGAGPDDESDAGGRSDGCGQASPASGEFEQRELEVERETRIFHLLVPDSYDPDRAYPLVFRFHGSGGDGLSGGLGIEFSSREDAIIVAPNGLNNSWSPRNHDTDVAFFDAMLETIADEYCIDLGRVYSYGFSAGGSFTNLLGCVRGNALRATASIASAYREGSCQGSIAAWFLHDADDPTVSIDGGRDARDRVLSANGCSDETVPEGDRCVRYEGCAPGLPVVWCETNGIGHNIQADFAPEAVWEFFSSLP